MSRPLIIRNGVVALPSGPSRSDILCRDGRIVAIGNGLNAPEAEVVNAAALTIGPGFVDVHVHGGGGHSFLTHDQFRIRDYAAWAPRNGVTSFLVSTVGRDAADTVEIFAALRPAIHSTSGAEPLGFHLEGPFINPLRHGAFPPAMLRPPVREEFLRFQEAAGGHIRQVTLAPELPLALDLAGAITASGAIPAMGHTDANSEQCRAGFESGIRHVTHLFNAMRPIHQREGGPIVAALLEDAVTCELICDGAHVDPAPLLMAYRILGPHRTVVVTDNLHLAGMHADSGRFAGEDVTVSGGKAAKADGTIVGSVETMDQHFRNTMRFLGISISTAFRLCSTNPARVAGASNRKGQVERGMDADLVLLDGDLQVQMTVCRGEIAFDRRNQTT
ncbi:N-acetylglucosamine-6-phosphate deacetylase [Candidatus Amarobacter glycogenicus]|uniref:N-acetylglucosamine-6-phosphate deacetylase n=1 Tax=Candidatus Amarobacter glycogenicus TaxID=3140699 RepID=UPI003136FCEA|nr:N-acetylglucosamine-6-phosphate deacetylase [Dehalococcoidia bacterium]